MKIDGKTEQELINCIDWIYTKDGEFWQKNILSGKKLREKFDTMNMQIITKYKSPANITNIDFALQHNVFDVIENIPDVQNN